MGAFLIEAAAFALRWLHVVAAIAWIGESFYFVMLDHSLKPAKISEPGVVGESWSVHGGGFYLKRKFMPAPPQLPDELHWSKWKSYTTWLSGFALFTLLYLSAPRLYLIDSTVAALSPSQAVGLAIGFLIVGWLVYDALCRVLGFRDGLLGVSISALVLALCYAATHLFVGGAAFLLVGAALGTIMSANVFFVIIPGQKQLVAALARGDSPDPLAGLRGKQRSVHNTYFTLPVVFAMLGNHYAIAYASEFNWLVLAVFMASGALIRQFFVLWHDGKRAWWLLVGGGLIMLAAFAWLAPRTGTSATLQPAAPKTPVAVTPTATTTIDQPATMPPDISTIHAIVVQRCGACHSAHPRLMASAPKGVMFDTPEQIQLRAPMIYQQAVKLHVMPPGNITQISDSERAVIASWYEGSRGVQR